MGYSRKGNGRKGPALPRHLRQRMSEDFQPAQLQPEESDGDDSLQGLSLELKQIRKCLSFDPHVRRVSRTGFHVRLMARVTQHEILEDGNEWSQARRSADVDLSHLPSEGESLKSKISWSEADATTSASARQRVAARKRRVSGDASAKVLVA